MKLKDIFLVDFLICCVGRSPEMEVVPRNVEKTKMAKKWWAGRCEIDHETKAVDAEMKPSDGGILCERTPEAGKRKMEEAELVKGV